MFQIFVFFSAVYFRILLIKCRNILHHCKQGRRRRSSLYNITATWKEKIKFIQYFWYVEGEDQVYPLLLVRRRRKSSLSDITGTQKDKNKFIQYFWYVEGEDQVYPILLVRRRRKSSLSDITGTQKEKIKFIRYYCYLEG